MSDSSSTAYWWVNQGSTYQEALAGGFIWAPQKSNAGRQINHWTNVSRVRAGDIIFHYANGEVKAVSMAKKDGYAAKKELEGSGWSDDGWRVDADYEVLARPVPIQEIGAALAALHMEGGPIDKTGGVKQGYLFALTEEAVALFVDRVRDDPALEAVGIVQSDFHVVKAETGADLLGAREGLYGDLMASSVRAEQATVLRLMATLLSKRFLILTGLAGSGKTKLAQAMAHWMTPDPDWIDAGDQGKGKNPNPYYSLVPVGPDWTGNENIIGYPDGLDGRRYITKPALELIRHALEPANANVPHYLILDEMNLSHVERYFADILSAIESQEAIPLYEGPARASDGQEVPRKLRLPDNLFIIGTVNVDETTYMFSPKVLDRANVIEFRMEPAEMAGFLAAPVASRLEELDGKGTGFGKAFVEAAAGRALGVPASVQSDYEKEMLRLFNLLREHGAEFGYRTGYEAARFVHFYKLLGGYSDDSNDWFRGAMDAIIVQKVLPKLHGSRSRLEGLLWALAWACGTERTLLDGKDFAEQLTEAGKAEDDGRYGPEVVWKALQAKSVDNPAAAARYPLSLDKVMRMWRKLVRDQFASFAEA